MLKRILIILSLTVAMIVAAKPLQTVHGIHFSTVQLAIFNRLLLPNAVPSDTAEKQDAKGNGFLRALKAPFKAISRLFGHGKKDDHKPQRLTAKDIKNFESSPADPTGTTPPPQTSATNPRALVIDPNEDALQHLEKGRAFLQAGNLNEAIEELSQAASLNNDLAEAQTLLGIAYEGKGLHDRATRSFEAAVIANSNNPQALNNLGYQLYKNGDYEGAAKSLKRAAKLAPDDARIWNNLGLTQCERGRFDDAVKSFAHSMGEYKGRLTVSKRLQDQGFTKEAIKHLEKARSLQPNSSEVLAQLIKLYQRSDKPEQAENARRSLADVLTAANTATP